MKCIYCNTEPNKPILDKGLKVCCCLMFQKEDGIYTQYYRDGKITHPTEKEGVDND